MIRRHGMVIAAAALSLLVGLAFIACGSEQATAQDATTEPAPAPVSAQAAVAKIVFVDQEKACDCTMARIDKSWAALQEVIVDQPVPVERIHGDSQEVEAKPYVDMKPLMVAPGLYFMDADGKLVEMLQGELTASQIAALLPS